MVQANITDGGITTATFYEYDTRGIRQQETTGGITCQYLVDTNRAYAQVIEEADTLSGLTRLYTHGDDLINQSRISGGNASNASIDVYLYDGLGSVRSLSNATGSVTDTYVYQAFGDVDVQIGTTPNRYLYTGEQYDPNVGFYYLRARYYNPSIGRFQVMDTYAGRMHEPQTLHKYLYVHADPVNSIDPSGRFSLSQVATVSAVIGIVALSTNNSVAQFQQSKHGKGRTYHEYETSQLTICTKSEIDWCTVDAVWEWMRRMPAPRFLSNNYLAEPLNNNDTTCCIGGGLPFAFGGQIRVEIGKYYVNNVTTKYHALAYGRVDRKIIDSGGRIYIDTLGYGENRVAFIAWLNDQVGPDVFDGHDMQIRQAILSGPVR